MQGPSILALPRGSSDVWKRKFKINTATAAAALSECIAHIDSRANGQHLRSLTSGSPTGVPVDVSLPEASVSCSDRRIPISRWTSSCTVRFQRGTEAANYA